MLALRRLSMVAMIGAVALLLASSALGEPRGGSSPVAAFGYALANDGGIRFADEYQRLGGVDTLGYPASHRFQLPDGLLYQLTQGALLQWRPERNGAMLANTFEMLESAGLDDWLYSFKGIPRPIKDDGSGGDWPKAKEIRLGWLTHAAIKTRYLASPNPEAYPQWTVDYSVELYGLPMSRPERLGPFIVQRFQRIAFQLWLDEVPGMPAPGSVVRVLGGDLLKEAGLVPVEALAPEERPGPTPVPTALPPTPIATPKPMSRALTPTPVVPPTPTIGPVPTPDPNHPPRTGTFTDHWKLDRRITVRLHLVPGRRGPTEGVFQNLALTDIYVEKTLSVTLQTVVCPTGYPSCQQPTIYLLRSLAGEFTASSVVDVVPPSWQREWWQEAELIASSEGSLRWTIQYGQYLLYFGTRGPNPSLIRYLSLSSTLYNK